MTNIISNTVKTMKNWWLFLVSGILLILFSIIVFLTPIESYLSLSLVFCLIVFINGISNSVIAVSNRKELSGWGWYFVAGLFEILIGLILILFPAISMITLPMIIAFWLLFRGIQVIASAIEFKKIGIMDWGWLMIIGIGLSLISLFMMLFPVFGPFNVVMLTSFALMLNGISFIIASFQLKKMKTKILGKNEKNKNDLKEELKDLKVKIKENIKSSNIEEQMKNIDKSFADYETRALEF